MIPVVFSTDHNFIMPTGVAIYSLLDSGRDSAFDIFILQGDDVTDSDREKLTALVSAFNSKISFISPGDYFANSYEVRGISTASYYRLLIPWLIPQYDKIIYLDGDLIVKVDIGKMLELTADEDKLVYGVRTPGFTLDEAYYTHIASLGLNPHEYINGGVQVYNSKLIRELNLKSEILSYTDKKLLFQDQDIINIVCKGRIGWLPLKYNSSPMLNCRDAQALIEAGITTRTEYDEGVRNPSIIHYAGPKPWKTFTYHWYDWWTAYAHSPFYDVQFAYNRSRSVMHPGFTTRQLCKMLLNQLFKAKRK